MVTVTLYPAWRTMMNWHVFLQPYPANTRVEKKKEEKKSIFFLFSLPHENQLITFNFFLNS